MKKEQCVFFMFFIIETIKSVFSKLLAEELYFIIIINIYFSYLNKRKTSARAALRKISRR